MKTASSLICPLLLMLFLFTSCGYEKTYFHNRNGKIKHIRAHKMLPWFASTPRERKYNKRTRRVMRRWDRSLSW